MADGSIPERRPAAIPPPGTRGITYGSVCDGMGAAHVASRGLGWLCAWLAEIDPQASAATAHHYPEVPNLGDITAPDFIDRALAVGELDMLVGGTPCQSFSISGLRKGLEDARGNLTLRFVELADATGPDGLPVELVFWENVPGVLSDSTNAFGCLLAALVGEDSPIPAPRAGWTNAGLVAGPTRTAAWRVLDAQGFVAQRRRRVFVVAARHGSRVSPERVLFETEADALRGLGDRAHAGPLFPKPEGVRRDTAQGRGAGQGTTIGTLAGTLPGGGWRVGADEAAAGQLIPVAFGGNNTAGPISVATALNAHGGPCGRLDFESETFIAQPLVGTDFSKTVGAMAANGGTGKKHGHGMGQQDWEAGYAIPVAYRTSPNFGVWETGDGIGADGDPAPTLQATQQHGVGVAFNGTGMAVRRLTPHECLKLQSFPDDYFDGVTYRGKPLADGPMYKMIGNSWNTDTVRWIFRRIDAQWRGAA